MTLRDLEALNTNFLTAAQIAPILGANPHYIRIQAQQAPQKLGFPVVVLGTRVKIPKIPFLKFMGVDKP
jgi:hypothetical protein